MKKDIDTLDRFDRVERHPLHYEHHIKVIYPKENVNNMKESWKKSIEQGKDFIANLGRTEESAISDGLARLDGEVERVKSRIATLNALPADERAKVLLKEFEDFCNNEDSRLKQLEDARSNFISEVKKQTKAQREQVLDDIRAKEEALRLWENPEKCE